MAKVALNSLNITIMLIISDRHFTLASSLSSVLVWQRAVSSVHLWVTEEDICQLSMHLRTSSSSQKNKKQKTGQVKKRKKIQRCQKHGKQNHHPFWTTFVQNFETQNLYLRSSNTKFSVGITRIKINVKLRQKHGRVYPG